MFGSSKIQDPPAKILHKQYLKKLAHLTFICMGHCPPHVTNCTLLHYWICKILTFIIKGVTIKCGAPNKTSPGRGRGVRNAAEQGEAEGEGGWSVFLPVPGTQTPLTVLAMSSWHRDASGMAYTPGGGGRVEEHHCGALSKLAPRSDILLIPPLLPQLCYCLFTVMKAKTYQIFAILTNRKNLF